jgi:hypothetical protein
MDGRRESDVTFRMTTRKDASKNNVANEQRIRIAAQRGAIVSQRDFQKTFTPSPTSSSQHSSTSSSTPANLSSGHTMPLE